MNGDRRQRALHGRCLGDVPCPDNGMGTPLHRILDVRAAGVERRKTQIHRAGREVAYQGILGVQRLVQRTAIDVTQHHQVRVGETRVAKWPECICRLVECVVATALGRLVLVVRRDVCELHAPRPNVGVGYAVRRRGIGYRQLAAWLHEGPFFLGCTQRKELGYEGRDPGGIDGYPIDGRRFGPFVRLLESNVDVRSHGNARRRRVMQHGHAVSGAQVDDWRLLARRFLRDQCPLIGIGRLRHLQRAPRILVL